MSNSAASTSVWYGAYELKSNYQRHLAKGVLFASVAHLIIVGGWLFVKYLQSRDEGIPAMPTVIRSLSQLAPPPSMTTAPPQMQVAEPIVTPPSIGIPTPVADEDVVEEVRFATREELALLSNPVGSMAGTGNDSVVVDIPLEDYFPASGEFVAVEEMPVCIHEEKPVYPDVAKLTGQSGTVWIEVLLDKEGKVREAKVAKSSGSNVGFDDAALEAAYKNIYKPAIQNGRPIPIRVTYPVKFSLK